MNNSRPSWYNTYVESTHKVYLDYAAATPIDPKVVDAMLPYFSDNFYNPSAAYAPAIQVRHDYEAAKSVLAQTIGAKKDQLVMTAGATESINLAFSCVRGSHVVTTNIEHQAVLSTLQNYDSTIVPVAKTGRVDPENIKQAITDKTCLVSVGLVNSELGVMQPLAKIAALIHDIRVDRRKRKVAQPIYLHSDASQAGAYFDVKVSRLGVDMLTISAAKLYGPKQVALLYVANEVELRPVVLGGGQEMGLRSGTENVAGVIGFAKAMQLAESRRNGESKRLTDLMTKLQTKLQQAIPDMVIAGDLRSHIPSICSLAFPGVDGERLMFGLEQDGVYVATGSACAANLGQRSHVLTAIGLEPELVDGSLRISIGRNTTEQDIDYAAEKIIARVSHERNRGQR